MSAEFAAETERLAAVAAGALGEPGEGLEAVETAIRTAMIALGRSLLEHLLATDPGHRGPRVECGAGHDAEFISYRTRTIDTVVGPVRLRRAYYHCTTCGRGVVPLDTELGMGGQSLSPGLRAMIGRAAAVVPFAQARGLLAELAGIGLTTKRVERCAETDGQAAAEVIATESAAIVSGRVVPLRPAEVPDMLYVAIDGTGVPMVAAAVEGRPGKAPDGRAHTREVKLACCYTQTTVDDDGYPVRDEDSASYAATFAPAAEFGVLMAAEAKRRGIEHVRQPVILGDGAVWIWNLANRYFPAATQIVDLYHAREHLHELADIVAFIHGGRASEQHRQWLADRLTDLDNGNIDTLCNNAYDLPLVGVKAADRDKALAYFETNSIRMQYARFRSLGMFVGSGMVEAGCKAVVGQRLKLSGMRWNIPGATGVLTLRCHHASGHLDQIWQRPHNQTLAA